MKIGTKYVWIVFVFVIALGVFYIFNIPFSNAKDFCSSNPPFKFLAKTGSDDFFCGKNDYPPRIRQVDCGLFSCQWAYENYQSDEDYLKDTEVFDELHKQIEKQLQDIEK